MRRMRQIQNNRVTPRGNGKEGLSISGNADFGNGLGLGIENGRNGTTGSLTILGSQQGTVDQNGNYEANANFLAEINGQDIADLVDTVERRRLAEENERNPAKNAKDAKDAPTQQPEEGPSGLVDVGAALFTGGLAALTAYGARLMAGGSSSSSPRAPAGNTANAETPVVGRKPRDEDEKDGKVKGEGDTKDEPPKKQPTKEELANFKDNIFWNTTKAATDDYLAKLDKQGVDTKEMRAHAEEQRAAGVRDLTPEEIKAKRLNKELNELKIELDKASDVASLAGAPRLDVGPSLVEQLAGYRKTIQDKIEAKTKELGLVKEAVNADGKSRVTARGGKEGESNSSILQNRNGENTPSKAAQVGGTAIGLSDSDKPLKDSLKSNASIALEKIVNPEKLDKRLEIKFGDSSIIRDKGEQGLTLKFGPNKDDIVKLKSTEDLKFLFDNSKDNSLLSYLKPKSYGYVDESSSVRNMLNNNLVQLGKNYRENPDIEKSGGYGGNPNAKNEFGSGQFNHEVSLQVLMSKELNDVEAKFKEYKKDIFKSDLDAELKSRIVFTINPVSKKQEATIRGMECNGTSFVNILKSSGLVRPDTSRVDFEKKFTSIHNQSSNTEPIVPDKYNNALRFKSNGLPKGSPILDQNTAVEIVKKMQESDWSKITGMSDKRFSAVSVNSTELKATLSQGYVVRASGYLNGDYPNHYRVISSSLEDNFIRVDESLEKYRVGVPLMYDPKSYKNLWRLNAK